MTGDIDTEDIELNDTELLTVLKNHGIGRRRVMQLVGAGAGIAALGGTASAAKQGGVSIDEVYGAPFEASESVPSGVVDQLVELHLHPQPSGPPEFFFDPVGIHLNEGEVINFNVHSGLHTVTAVHSKFGEPPIFDFPDRVPENGFTSPVMNTGDSWLYRFTTPGIYDIMCLPHYDPFGMVVRVVVTSRNPNEPMPSDTYDDSLLPPAVEAVFDAPEMTPSNIIDKGTVAWDDLTL